MTTARPLFPFVALVGQDEMKRALVLNLVCPEIGGVLLLGHRGTGKSTAVRALAALMPRITVVGGCPYHCAPDATAGLCGSCTGGEIQPRELGVPVVDLPLGASEDRVVGTLDLEAALLRGERSFEPGLLARANRGFLYIDEVNLLEDHLVDLLLDVAASGENVVERESVSIRHPSRFVLVGSGNPEEGELRPQLLDRFGVCVDVTTETDVERRLEITRRRLAYENDPAQFVARFEAESLALRDDIALAREIDVEIDRELCERIALLNAQLEIPGHRGELTMARAAKAHAALDKRDRVELGDLASVAEMSLRHRIKRDPLDHVDVSHRIGELVAAWTE